MTITQIILRLLLYISSAIGSVVKHATSECKYLVGYSNITVDNCDQNHPLDDSVALLVRQFLLLCRVTGHYTRPFGGVKLACLELYHFLKGREH
jgi:hypothetical protein